MSNEVSNEEELAATWRSRSWRDEATGWLDECLGSLGMERIVEVSQPHLEPWSTILSADTDRGRVWLKAMVAETSFEIGLYDLLVQVDPEHVLHPLASDRERGWLLYDRHGIDRQELTRELLVAVARGAFRFAAGLAEAEAMKKALLGLTRDVREDGPGSELCIALSLALRRPPPKPRVY